MPIIEGSGYGRPLQNAGVPGAGTNEVQLLTYTAIGAGSNVATAGTFKVAFDGYRTTALAFNVSAADLIIALNLLPSINAAGVSATLGAGPPRVYTVTFDGGNMAKLAVPLFTIVDNLLTDAAVLPVNVVVTASVEGVTAAGRSAPKGALMTDTTNGKLYQNSGTALAPVWGLVGVQA